MEVGVAMIRNKKVTMVQQNLLAVEVASLWCYNGSEVVVGGPPFAPL